MNRQSTHGTEESEMSVLALSRLGEGMPGLTPDCGGCLAEAASVVLEIAGHVSGAELSVRGIESGQYAIEWNTVTEQIKRTYADVPEATEWGACAVAVLLLEVLTGLVVVERSCKGTGFDYWLGREDTRGQLFQVRARLEISGMLKGTSARFADRVRRKIKQTRASDETRLPAWIVVVKFDEPRAHVEQR